jgi:hypothetical protein
VRTVNPSLLLLILVWVAILLPGALRSRLRPSPRASVGGFQRTMDGLRVPQRVVPTHVATHVPSSSGAVVLSRPEDPVVARRRRRTLRLYSFTALSLVAAPLLGGAAWLVAVLLVVTSAATTAILRRLKLQRDAARHVVVSLDLRRPAQPLVDEITGELVVAAGVSSSAVRLPSWRG